MTRVTAFPIAETAPPPPLQVDQGPLLIVLRGWMRIVGCVLLVTGLAAGWALTVAVPTYRSTTTLMLEPQEPTVIDLTVVMPALGRDAQILNSQVEVLRSRLLVGALVDDLGLVEDPEFNPHLAQPHPRDPRPSLREHVARLLGREIRAEPPDAENRRNTAIDRLQDRLDIGIEPESLIISLVVTTSDPGKSAWIANRLSEFYVADQLRAKRDATEEATRWLTGRVVELKAALEAAEMMARQARADHLGATSEAVAESERRLAALQLRRDSTRPDTGARQRLDTEIATVTTQIEAASDALVKLAQLDREVEATAFLYETFLSRLKETSVQDGAQRSDVRVLSPAVPPRRPYTPNTPLVLALAIILSAGLGALWVLMREEWRVKLRTVEEVERAAQLPVLATLPEIPDHRRDLLDEIGRRPSGAAAEAVRTLRSGVLLANIDAPPKVITLTSSVAGEGKTTTTLLLAQTLASWEKSVLVIEADIRGATLQRRFGLTERRGLLSVLAGLCRTEDVAAQPAGFGFTITPGEPTAGHAADVFATGRFTAFVRDMKEKYDHILIDTPPVLSAADARMIGRVSDAVVYLYRWNRTRRSQLRRGLSLFRSFGQPVTGVAMTRAPGRRLAAYATRRR